MSTDWNTEAGGLHGLGRKPEDTARLPKATPAHQRPKKWPSPAPNACQPRPGTGLWLHIWGLWSHGLGGGGAGRWLMRRATVKGAFLRVLVEHSPPATLILLYGVVSGLFGRKVSDWLPF